MQLYIEEKKKNTVKKRMKVKVRECNCFNYINVNF